MKRVTIKFMDGEEFVLANVHRVTRGHDGVLEVLEKKYPTLPYDNTTIHAGSFPTHNIRWWREEEK